MGIKKGVTTRTEINLAKHKINLKESTVWRESKIVSMIITVEDDRIESKRYLPYQQMCMGWICLLSVKILSLAHEDLTIYCTEETHLKQNDSERLKIKGWTNVFQENGNTKKAGIATLTSDQVGSKQ